MTGKQCSLRKYCSILFSGVFTLYQSLQLPYKTEEKWQCALIPKLYLKRNPRWALLFTQPCSTQRSRTALSASDTEAGALIYIYNDRETKFRWALFWFGFLFLIIFFQAILGSQQNWEEGTESSHIPCAPPMHSLPHYRHPLWKRYLYYNW